MARHTTAFMYQMIMSFYAPIPAILVINIGWGAKAVGFVAALYSLGNIVSNYFWPRYAAVSQRAGVISLGLLGIMAGSFLLQNSSTLIPAIIIMSLVPSAAYHHFLYGVKRQDGDLSTNIAKFYESDSAGRMAGMVLGAVTSYFFPIDKLASVLFFSSIIMTALTAWMIGEEGLIPIFNKGIAEMGALNKSLRGFGIKYVGEIGLTRRMMPYLLTSGLFSFAFALVYPQLPTIVEFIFGNATLFYALSILSRIFGTVAFKLVRMVGNKLLMTGWTIRFLSFFFIFAAFRNKWMLVAFFVVSGIGWAFIKTFYGVTNLSSGEKLTSLNLFVRSVSYTASSFISGGLIVGFGIPFSVALSTLIFMIAPLPLVAEKVLKLSKDKDKGGPVAQLVRAPVL